MIHFHLCILLSWFYSFFQSCQQFVFISLIMADTLNLNYSLFGENISKGFRALQSAETLCDVTLVCDDGEVAAHKVVLFTGSEFFQKFLPRAKHPNPYVYMRGMQIQHVRPVIEFMYNGEVQIPEDEINQILDIAKDLQVAGLSEGEEQLHPKSVMEEAVKVSKKLEELQRKLLNSSEKESRPKVALKLNEVFDNTISDEANEIHDELESKALNEMSKGFDAEGRTSWICKFCGFCCNDKSRTKRHVKNQHLKERKRSTAFESIQLTTAIHNENNIEEFVVEEKDDNDKRRPRTRSQKRELDDLINSIQQLDDSKEHVKEIEVDQDANVVDSQLDFNFLDESSKLMDEQALEMMEKNHDEYGKVSWICKICEYSCNDKTRTKRHIRNNHLKRQKIGSEKDDHKEMDTNNISSLPEETLNESTMAIRSNFDEEDIQALNMMTKKKSEETGGTVWECSACEMSHFDKTRVRKHVKSRHIQSQL